MVQNEKKLELATYYRQRGFSYSEISKLVGVSKGTLSAWFSKQNFSKNVKEDNLLRAGKDNARRIVLLNKVIKKEREKSHKVAVKQADVEYKHYKSNPLFVAGLMLYFGVGDMKQPNLIRIASSKIDTHRIFAKFVTSFLGVKKEKFHFWLLLYPTHLEKDCVQVWSKALKLKPEQFYKNQIIQRKDVKSTLQYGVGNTIIGDVVLKQKLQRWIELLIKDLSK